MDTHSRTSVPQDTYKQVEVNNTTIHYLEVGSRSTSTPTLILSHAHLSDIRSWTTVQALLAKHYHIITYSRRFFWPNAPIQPDEHDDWHLHARDLATLITTLSLAPVHIMGNSSGATILLLLAQTHPELLSSIILEEPPLPYVFLPTLPPTPWAVLSLLFTHPTAFLPVLLFGINVVAPTEKHCKANPPRKLEALEVFAPGAASTATWQKMKSDPDQSRMKQALDNLDVVINAFRYTGAPVISPADLAKVRTPVLVLTGSETIPAQKCMDWKIVMCVNSERGMKREKIVEKAAHLIHEDQPERVTEEVVAWIREVEGINKGGD